ncbi:MAG: cell wall hydrolase [bacterium]
MRHLSIIVLMLFAGCASASNVSPSARSGNTAETPDHSAAKHCLALAMYWEARGEGEQGMLAVGSVVQNRVDSQLFPDTVCEVVKQGGEKPGCQFSWWCDGKSDRPTNKKVWRQAQILASQLLKGRFDDPTRGALFFHHVSLEQPWDRPRTRRIGDHYFYR